MKMKKLSLRELFKKIITFIKRFMLVIFILFLAGVYGYIGWRIVSLSQVQPDETAVTSKLKTAGVPRIDQETLTKLQRLQDNSVEVKTLFDKARSNPFQE